jgi:hypothetical protein
MDFKNCRVRKIAIDDLTASMLLSQLTAIEDRAREAGVSLVADPYLFSDAADAATQWKPDSVSQYFGRLCVRAGVEHLTLHSLRKFMETYGQEMGYRGAKPYQVGYDTPPALGRRWRNDAQRSGRWRRDRAEEFGECDLVAAEGFD